MQVGEQRVAGRGVALHLRQAREHDQELAGALDQALLIGGGEAGQPRGVLPGGIHRLIPLLVRGQDQQPERRQQRDEHQEEEADAQVGERGRS